MKIESSLPSIENNVANGGLLKADEEVTLAGVIRQAQERFVRLSEQGLMKSPALELSGWSELINKLESDGAVFGEDRELYEDAVKARELFFQANRLLIYSVVCERARKRRLNDDQVAEMEQEAGKGLLRAIERFNPDAGNKFSTYAHWWIEQKTYRKELEVSSEFDVPDRVNRAVRKLQWIRSEILDSGGDVNDDALLRERMGNPIGDDEWELVKLIADSRMTYLNQPIQFDDGEGGEIGDVTEDTNAVDPEEAAYETGRDELVRKIVREALVQAKESERNIELLMTKWGLLDGRTRTRRETAKEAGVTGERIKQIEVKALNRIRKYAKWKGIAENYFGDYDPGKGI